MRGISMTLTLVVLAGFYLATKDQPTSSSAEPYHASIAKAVELESGEVGGWVVVDRPPVPPAATQLLKPNALSARVLRNTELGAQATLIVVQCKDTRDMAGHYPPNCYPAHGWKWQEEPGPPGRITIDLANPEGSLASDAIAGSMHSPQASVAIPYQLYRFRQPNFPRDRQIKIYSFFTIPGQGLVSDIDSVRKAAEDYRVRPYGAAQIQVIFDGSLSDEQGEALFKDLMQASSQLVRLLSVDPLNMPGSVGPGASGPADTPATLPTTTQPGGRPT